MKQQKIDFSQRPTDKFSLVILGTDSDNFAYRHAPRLLPHRFFHERINPSHRGTEPESVHTLLTTFRGNAALLIIDNEEIEEPEKLALLMAQHRRQTAVLIMDIDNDGRKKKRKKSELRQIAGKLGIPVRTASSLLPPRTDETDNTEESSETGKPDNPQNLTPITRKGSPPPKSLSQTRAKQPARQQTLQFPA